MQNQNSAFEKIRKTLLKEHDIAEKKMFGTTALTSKGKVFAFLWKEKLVLKLPKDRVSDIIASKKGAYFDPGHGRISKEWVTITPSTQNEWINLSKEAKAFVASVKK